MNVAIIGAGLAGLSCAHELERHGLHPVVFERNSFIGEAYPHVSATLEIVTRPIKDSLDHFRSLGIEIRPLDYCKKIVHHSPHATTIIKGNLGYFFRRDQTVDDLKVQIHSTLRNTKILFNELADFRTLEKEYDYVVIANGDSNFTEELGCWHDRVTTFVRGAIILGEFDPNALIIWLNKDYCKDGYAYLTPFNRKQASIALIATDVSEKEIDPYWDLFWHSTEMRQYTIVEEFKLEHKSATVYPYRVGNVLFAGDAAGIIDPFLGFGSLSAITMGVMAARAIAEGSDYATLMNDITQKNIKLFEFRKAINGSTNFMYDMVVTSIGLPGIKHALYYTPLDITSIGSFLLKHLPVPKKV
jgi:digeranylgeranylglycerophospholipid reductase